jgi:hypothetical protein
MSEAVSLLPLALAEVEQDIGVVDVEAERLTTKLAELEVKKLSLQKTARGLQELLGIVPPAPATGNNGHVDPAGAVVNTNLLPRNVFRGMPPSAAARKFLRAIGHRVTHAELVEALVRGNVKSRAQYPSDSFRAAMMRRADWFVWKKEVGHFGYWELVEWQGDETASTTAISKPTLALVR